MTLEAPICEKETSLPIPLWSEKDGINASLQESAKALTVGEHTLKVVLELGYTEGYNTRKLPMASSTITLIKE